MVSLYLPWLQIMLHCQWLIEKDYPDQVTLRDQFLAFEKGSKANDDGPDAVHGAFKELFTITRVDKFPVRTTSRAEMRSRSKNTF